jgi:hypothetical protein
MHAKNFQRIKNVSTENVSSIQRFQKLNACKLLEISYYTRYLGVIQAITVNVVSLNVHVLLMTVEMLCVLNCQQVREVKSDFQYVFAIRASLLMIKVSFIYL